MRQYVGWAGETNLDAFWWSPVVMELFKRHIDVMTSRVNTYNGAGHSFAVLCHSCSSLARVVCLRARIVASPRLCLSWTYQFADPRKALYTSQGCSEKWCA